MKITFIDSIVDLEFSRVAVGIAISKFIRDQPLYPSGYPDILGVSPEIACRPGVTNDPPSLARYIMAGHETLKLLKIDSRLPPEGWYICNSDDSTIRYSVKWPTEFLDPKAGPKLPEPTCNAIITREGLKDAYERPVKFSYCNLPRGHEGKHKSAWEL